jgi:DNA-binding beta-propeller fold protein YncE
VAFDSGGNLWVVDGFNNRVLEFIPPFANHMNASLVIGQADFVTGTSGLSSTKFNDPEHLAFDSGGNLWVADSVNNRVLEFKPPFANGMAATLVIGQPDFVSNPCLSSATGMCATFGVAFDSKGNLWVGDDGNCRALEFTPPFASNMAASLELGQAAGANQFTDSCVAAAPTQSGLSDALGLAFDSSGNLFLADFGDNRTLVFSPPFSNGMNASHVLGQADFVSFLAPAPPTATSQNSPEGVATSF